MPLISSLLELLYPVRCGICGRLGDRELCAICEAGFISADTTITEPEWRGGLDSIARLYHYEGRAEQAVRRLKYARATVLAGPMSERLFRFAQNLGLDDAEAIIPVPIHWSRRCDRGFNQSALLCEAFDRKRLKPELLHRTRATRQQVGLTPEERRKNLSGAFWASPHVAGHSVLLVDDVITSGHTARECARILKTAGAESVVALAFAGDRSYNSG